MSDAHSMKLLLHIGTEKTGTTTLQEVFHLNRDFLIRQGFYYLSSMGERNHRSLASYGMPEQRFDDFMLARKINDAPKREAFDQEVVEKLRQELACLPDGIHTVIASSEHFHSRCTLRRGIEKLACLLQPFFSEIQILVYLRPQIDVAVSLRSTGLKVGVSYDFDAAFLHNSCHPGNYYYNYAALLNNWGDVFGEDTLRPRLFDRKEFVAGDLISDALDVCNIAETYQDDRLIRPPPLNESLNPFGQFLLQELNRTFPRAPETPGGTPLVRKIQGEIIRHCTGNTSIAPALAWEIQSAFQAVNETVRQRWFPSRTTLFDFAPEKYAAPKIIFGATESAAMQAIFSLFPPESSQKHDVDSIRDAAIALEESNPEQARQLMKIAARLRPQGSLIRKKLEEYERVLARKNT